MAKTDQLGVEVCLENSALKKIPSVRAPSRVHSRAIAPAEFDIDVTQLRASVLAGISA